WTSSDPEVATIDATTGAITLTGAGPTIITATSLQSDTHTPGSTMYTLTVTPFPPVLTDMGIEAEAFRKTPLEEPVLVQTADDSADIKECFFLDSTDNNAPVSSLDDLSIAVATDGRACEISGILTGDGVQPGITVQALSTTGEDTATVVFTVTGKPLGLVRQIDLANLYTCAVNTDDELYCWGNGDSGRLGLTDTDGRTTPTKVGTTANWTQVSVSNFHTCAVNTDDELYCWGNGDDGRLGLTDTDGRTTPAKVGSSVNWTQVNVGALHTCAMNTIGELYCWGNGGNGQLGLGSTGNQTTPAKVGSSVNWTQVSAGGRHTCAVNTAGELYCWGLGFDGRLGIPDLIASAIPAKVGTASNNWTQVSASSAHTCAVNTAGELYCWGRGTEGQLGLTDTDGRTTPAKVGTTANWTQVSAIGNHTCAVNTAGELYCWGNGDDGRLGLTDTDGRTTPAKVGTTANWTQVSAGIGHTCAVNTAGELYCWGESGSGRLGLGTIASDITTPQAVNTARTPTVAPVLANIMLTGPAGVFGAGNIIAPLTFTNTGGDVQPDGCAIDTTSSRPDLPDGLRAHPIVSGSNVTCQISGIPTAATTMATYYLTATNAIGTSDAVTVSFQVDLVRPLLANITTEQSYTVGTDITAQTFTNTGLAVATGGCAASPALPAGLTLAVFDDAGKTTCQITGNPSAMATKATYVITATGNPSGTDEARVTITVAAAPGS
nr:hypothetical protein [Pseudomonadota bacterium]